MKTLATWTAVLLLSAAPAFAADSSAATDQAREDYRAYVQELKKLGQQYKEVTSQMREVIAEEGVPTWSDETDSIVMAKPDLSSATPAAAKADVRETDKDLTVRLDLPGLDRGAMKVSIEDEKTLRVRGRRKDTGEEVERVVALPAAAEGAEARYEDGVLSVTAKKSKQAKQEVAVPVR